MSNTRSVALPSESGVKKTFALVFAGWAFAAVVASAAGWISPELPPPAVPLMIWSPVLAFVAAFRFSADLRRWVLSWDLRWPILYHLCRVPFGAWFLVLHARGALEPTFALVAGPGDIVAGAAALLAVRAAALQSRRAAWIVGVWNTLALLDILVVFVTAQRIVFFGAGLGALAPLTTFPLGLIPPLVVPLILITHFVVFAQLVQALKAPRRRHESP